MPYYVKEEGLVLQVQRVRRNLRYMMRSPSGRKSPPDDPFYLMQVFIELIFVLVRAPSFIEERPGKEVLDIIGAHIVQWAALEPGDENGFEVEYAAKTTIKQPSALLAGALERPWS